MTANGPSITFRQARTACAVPQGFSRPSGTVNHSGTSSGDWNTYCTAIRLSTWLPTMARKSASRSFLMTNTTLRKPAW
jgi:hypothetical protein